MSEQEQLQQAKALIQQKQYAKARQILRAMPSNPVARRWLEKLDTLIPPEKPTQAARSPVIMLLLIAIPVVILLAGFVIFVVNKITDRETERVPDVSEVVGAVDGPANNGIVPNEFLLHGWAVDTSSGAGQGPGVNQVQIYEGQECSGKLLGEAVLAVPRPDVVEALELDASYTNSGFRVNLVAPQETFTLTTCVNQSSSGQLVKIATHTVSVTRLLGVIDLPAEGAVVAPFTTLTGWALNPDAGAENGPGVETIRVYQGNGCTGEILLETALSETRQDVVDYLQLDDSYLSSGFNTDLLLGNAGQTTFTLCAAIDGTFKPIQSRTVLVAELRGNIENPLPDATVTLPFEVKGWVMVLGSQTGSGIDMVRVVEGEGCAGTILAETTTFVERPDVTQYLGDLPEGDLRNGFQLQIPFLSPGTSLLSICVRSTLTGEFTILGVNTVQVGEP